MLAPPLRPSHCFGQNVEPFGSLAPSGECSGNLASPPSESPDLPSGDDSNPAKTFAGSEANPAKTFPGSTPRPRFAAAVYRTAIAEKLDAGLSLQRIWQDLVEEYGYGASYENVPSYQRNSYWENDIVRNRIARAFEQELTHRGLVQVSDPEDADFLADYQFAVEPRRQRIATPVYPAGLVCGYYGCSNGFYGPPGYYFRTVRYREGTIVFDLVDQNVNRLAYRAVRENVVHRDSFTDDEVREGVQHLLKGLKPN